MTCTLRLVFTFIFLSLLGACAAKPPADPLVRPSKESMEIIGHQPRVALPDLSFDEPQLVFQAVPLSSQSLLPAEQQVTLHHQAMQRFFAPWKINQTSLTADQAFWGVKSLGSKKGYAENLQPYPEKRWGRLVALQNMEAFPSMAQKAIITRNTAMRVLPSMRPFFLDPTKAGEGFPFDYFQASALWLGTPVLICHMTTDQAWYFVETAMASGWVRVEDVAWAGENFCAAYGSQAMAAIILDDTPLLSTTHFLGQTHIGAIFPLAKQMNNLLHLKIPMRTIHGQAEIAEAQLNFLQAVPMPMPLTSQNVAMVADSMSGQLYGWGGMFENRDCSSTMRDLFLPFGIWLPRNSAHQAQKGGQFIPLKGLSPAAKIKTIKAQAMPLASLLWLPGHIGLYLGTNGQGQPLMLHNMWGMRTTRPDGSEGRAVAGRLVISTLMPGEERLDIQTHSFLSRIQGLTLLGR